MCLLNFYKNCVLPVPGGGVVGRNQQLPTHSRTGCWRNLGHCWAAPLPPAQSQDYCPGESLGKHLSCASVLDSCFIYFLFFAVCSSCAMGLIRTFLFSLLLMVCWTTFSLINLFFRCALPFKIQNEFFRSDGTCKYLLKLPFWNK